MEYFVIVSHQRGGSHMLMSLLNSHPKVHCNTDFYSNDIYAHNKEWVYRVGFKTSRPYFHSGEGHFPEGKKPEVVGFLMKIKTGLHKELHKKKIKIILVHRENYLALLLSKKISLLVGCYGGRDGSPLKEAYGAREKMDPLEISIEDAEAWFKKYSTEISEVRTCLLGTDWIEVSYESLLTDVQTIMAQIHRHLGVPQDIATHTPGRGEEKLDKRLLSKAIANYNELKQHFAGTEYEWFFVG